MQNVLKQFEEKGTALLSGQFSRARIELTLIYAVILLFVLMVSSVITYSRFSTRIDLRWAAHRILIQQPIQLPPPPFDPEQNFPDEARTELALSLFLVNGVLIVGGIGLSYILAGITLQPIQQAYEKQRRFLSDASHELRTPLAIMQTDLENELADKKISANAKEQAQSHLEEVGRMSAIVKDLLLISRLDRETNKDVSSQLVDFSAIATGVITRLAPYAEKHSITLISKLPELPVMILAHPEHLSQAVMNLVKNAIDYNKKDGSVTVSLTIEKNVATLVVQDTGVGIPKKDLGKIFDRFYRADESRTRATGGSGLGLSIVQSIAKTYNGNISIQSDEKTGTHARLSFPLKNTP